MGRNSENFEIACGCIIFGVAALLAVGLVATVIHFVMKFW